MPDAQSPRTKKHTFVFNEEENCPEKFAFLDGPIRANRFADSRESLKFGSRESSDGFWNCTPFLRTAFRDTRNCESQVRGDTRESLERYENRVFLRIDSRESP